MDRNLIGGLKRAHKVLRDLNASPLQPVALLVDARPPENTYLRRLSSLAFLAPDIQEAILEGRQPAGFTLEPLIRNTIPPGWDDQRRVFGFSL